MIFLAEQTGAQFSVSGQPNARTVPAKRLRYWRNQADLTGGAVGESVFPRRLACFVRNLHQWPSCMNSRVNLGRRNHQLARPVPVRIQRHEFDESHDDAAFTRKRSE